MTYQPKVYRKQGGNELVVASGGQITVESGGAVVFPNPSGGVDYYVDGNSGADTNDGLTWATSFVTVAAAMAASHANIAASSTGWAARNRIFIKGDDFVETLVALAQKTDVIGVGSSDNYPYACIRGNHVPINGAMGCRFINVRFRPTASADLIVLASTTGGGVEFHHCLFDAHYGAFTAPSAIDSTASQYVKICDCDFLGAFSGDVIDIGAGSVLGMQITDNRISGGANDGIIVTDTTTVVQGRRGLIARNYIDVAKVTINDGEDSTFAVIDNRCISAAAYGATSHVITDAFASGNYVTGNGTMHAVPAVT